MTNRGRTHSRRDRKRRPPSTGNPRTEHNDEPRRGRGEARPDTYYYCSHRDVGRSPARWTRRSSVGRIGNGRVDNGIGDLDTGRCASHASTEQRRPLRRPPLGKADLQKRKRDELSPSLDLSNGRNEADDEAERSGTERSGVPLDGVVAPATTATTTTMRRDRRRVAGRVAGWDRTRWLVARQPDFPSRSLARGSALSSPPSWSRFVRSLARATTIAFSPSLSSSPSSLSAPSLANTGSYAASRAHPPRAGGYSRILRESRIECSARCLVLPDARALFKLLLRSSERPSSEPLARPVAMRINTRGGHMIEARCRPPTLASSRGGDKYLPSLVITLIRYIALALTCVRSDHPSRIDRDR